MCTLEHILWLGALAGAKARQESSGGGGGGGGWVGQTRDGRGGL